MKRLVLFLLLVAAAFGVAFGLTRLYHTRQAAPMEAVLDGLPELAWLRTELGLTDAQFERIAALHRAYRPHCVELCARITEAGEKVRAAADRQTTLTPELTDALEAQARVQAECQQAMLRHLYQTASVMNPEQARRFLDATLPHALNPGAYPSLHHDKSPGLPSWTLRTKN